MLTRAVLWFLHLHQAVYDLSDGRLGHRMLGVPCLLLRTVGRRTGKSRTSALVYARDDDDYVVVASLGGSDHPPAWLHNVRADPYVGVQVGRKRLAAVATVVERGAEDYDRLWRSVNEVNRGRYDGYQAKTSRPIPLVRLTPDP
jgi:deazaflavin-dependent oxidoreductase (nitroreductase family)